MSLKYRIASIGWHSFEILVQTLLKIVIGPGVESFGGSKDSGRDAVYSGKASFPTRDNQWGGNWLFQVKYIDFEEQGASAARSALKSTFRHEMSALLGRKTLSRHGVNTESPRRVRGRSKPDNYILITDIPLSGDLRDELKQIALDCGFEGNLATVDGKEICQFLDAYPAIRQSYPQLLGLADLATILNRDLYVRSEAYVEQWQPRLATYVLTKAHRDAFALLRKSFFLVLDGPPEAGKTTISAALGLSFAAVGFEIVDIRHSNEFFRAYDASKSQVFIADDAVGSISLDPTRADDWSRDLPSAVRKLDKTHLLIWTARRYILEEALSESRLGQAVAQFPRAHEVLVEVGALSTLEKAEILYNHAKAGKMRAELGALIKAKAADVILHGNFTPERIRQLIEIVLQPPASGPTQTLGWEAIKQFLDNPSERWSQAYRKLSRSEQALLAAMLDFDGPTPTENLRAGYDMRSRDVTTGRLSFDVCLSRLEHSFLRAVVSYRGESLVNFQHPSLRDMLLLELKHDSAARKRFLALANPFGLSSVIRGIAFRGDKEREPQHAVLPEDEAELETLLLRIGIVCGGVLTFKEWEQLLTAADGLIPHRKEPGRKPFSISKDFKVPDVLVKLTPAEVDLERFRKTDRGRILQSIAEAFAGRNTFENGQRFDAGQWSRLLRRFYDLSSYLIVPIVPQFTSDLVDRCGMVAMSSIALLNLAFSYEPIIMRQKLSRRNVNRWEEILEDNLDQLTQVGLQFESGEDPQNFDEWHAEVEGYLADAEEFCNLFQIGELEGIAKLQDLWDSVSAPEPPESDDEEYLPTAVEQDYWTIDRLFEDL